MLSYIINISSAYWGIVYAVTVCMCVGKVLSSRWKQNKKTFPMHLIGGQFSPLTTLYRSNQA